MIKKNRIQFRQDPVHLKGRICEIDAPFRRMPGSRRSRLIFTTTGDDPMTVKNMKEVIETNVPAGKGTTIQVLISSQEAPNFAMRRFVIQPGGGMPLHTNTLEHEQFVLTGEARVQIGKEIHFVKPGDVVFIPEGLPHSYLNKGDEDFSFLCIIPNKPDEIKVLEDEC
jgi:quercetin dioxygenase-like cupin family protein